MKIAAESLKKKAFHLTVLLMMLTASNVAVAQDKHIDISVAWVAAPDDR